MKSKKNRYFRNLPNQFIQSGYLEPLLQFSYFVMINFHEPRAIEPCFSTLSTMFDSLTMPTSKLTPESSTKVADALQNYFKNIMDGIYTNILYSFIKTTRDPCASLLQRMYQFNSKVSSIALYTFFNIISQNFFSFFLRQLQIS